MKVLAVFLMMARLSWGQISPGRPVRFAVTDPAGSCGAAYLQYNTLNGKLWGCLNGTWTLITGSGGGGSVTSIATTSPITGGTITTTGTIACATCVINNGVNTGTTAMTLDMSAATSANALLSPVIAGAAPTSSGSIAYDSTQGATKIGGGTGTAAAGGIRKVLSVQLGGTDASTGLVAATINTNETAFATQYTIPANYFIANKVLCMKYAMDETTSGTPVTQRIRIRLGGVGGTIVWDDVSPVTPTINLAGRNSLFEVCMTGTAAPGASVNVETAAAAGGLSPTTPFNVWNSLAQPVLVATNAQQIAVMTVTFSGNTAGNVVKLRSLVVEEIN